MVVQLLLRRAAEALSRLGTFSGYGSGARCYIDSLFLYTQDSRHWGPPSGLGVLRHWQLYQSCAVASVERYGEAGSG